MWRRAHRQNGFQELFEGSNRKWTAPVDANAYFLKHGKVCVIRLAFHNLRFDPLFLSAEVTAILIITI